MEHESVDNQPEKALPPEADPQLKELSIKLDKLIEKVDSGSKKDAWDKFGIITSFVSGVLFVVVGAIYTYIYNGREKEAQANAQRQATELQTLVALSPQLSSPDSNVRKSARAILTALKESQPKVKKENNASGENSIIDSFLAQASDKELPTDKRIRAVNSLATYASNPKVPDTVKQKIENTVVSIGKFGHSEPAALKDAANSTLLDILSKNNQKTVGLKPEVAELAKQLIAVAKDSAINLVITDGYRSPQKQDSLYNARVSSLRGNRGGAHEKGLAFDVAVYKDGKIDWNDSGAYKKVGEIGVKLGLTWGGSWKGFKDYFHFELKQ
jgi:LAS superfamily LD-carboxypeptidase LdcB